MGERTFGNYNQVTTQKKPKQQLLKTINISKTKPNKLKPGSGQLLRHSARKQIGSMLQLPGPALGAAE